MRVINIPVEDNVFEELKLRKGKLTWLQFLRGQKVDVIMDVDKAKEIVAQAAYDKKKREEAAFLAEGEAYRAKEAELKSIKAQLEANREVFAKETEQAVLNMIHNKIVKLEIRERELTDQMGGGLNEGQ